MNTEDGFRWIVLLVRYQEKEIKELKEELDQIDQKEQVNDVFKTTMSYVKLNKRVNEFEAFVTSLEMHLHDDSYTWEFRVLDAIERIANIKEGGKP